MSEAIEEARKSRFISRLIVNTDDDDIQKEAERVGADVIRRPEDMGSDIAEVDPLLKWTYNQLDVKPNIMVLLYCTAPLRTFEDIDSTIELVQSGSYDSALTLVEDHSYLWKKVGDIFVPQNYIPKNRAARQTESWNQFVENKAVYAFKAEGFIENDCRLYGRVGAAMMPAFRSIDVDDIEDLNLARMIRQCYGESAENKST